MRLIRSILAVLLIVPGWTGAERLPLIDPGVTVHAERYVPAGGWPQRVGTLAPVGAFRLSARDPAFGGFSAMAIRDGEITLLSDGGNFVRIAVRGGRVVTRGAGFLRQGPGAGWGKMDRDSESLAIDPGTGAAWVGYERANAIWRYAPGLDRATGWRKPKEMRRWRANAGAESLVRLADGRFLVVAERSPNRRRRDALLFAGDPTDARVRPIHFFYRPPAGFDPSDAAQLPGGDLLILNRRYRFPLSFTAKLVRVPLAALKPGAMVSGREIATLAPPLFDENAEALAVTVERGRTMLWIATDNDTSWFRTSWLYKFRLVE